MSEVFVKYLLFYQMAPDGRAKAQEHFPAHQARLAQFHQGGRLLMAGPYGNPPMGALGIFSSRAAAEEFIAGDPFVLHGVVDKYTLHEWSEVLAP